MSEVEDTAATAEDGQAVSPDEQSQVTPPAAPANAHRIDDTEKRVVLGVVAGLIGGALLVGTMLAVPAMVRGHLRLQRGYTVSRQMQSQGERGGMMGQGRRGRAQAPGYGYTDRGCPVQPGAGDAGPQSQTCPGCPTR